METRMKSQWIMIDPSEERNTILSMLGKKLGQEFSTSCEVCLATNGRKYSVIVGSEVIEVSELFWEKLKGEAPRTQFLDLLQELKERFEPLAVSVDGSENKVVRDFLGDLSNLGILEKN